MDRRNFNRVLLASPAALLLPSCAAVGVGAWVVRLAFRVAGRKVMSLALRNAAAIGREIAAQGVAKLAELAISLLSSKDNRSLPEQHELKVENVTELNPRGQQAPNQQKGPAGGPVQKPIRFVDADGRNLTSNVISTQEGAAAGGLPMRLDESQVWHFEYRCPKTFRLLLAPLEARRLGLYLNFLGINWVGRDVQAGVTVVTYGQSETWYGVLLTPPQKDFWTNELKRGGCETRARLA